MQELSHSQFPLAVIAFDTVVRLVLNWVKGETFKEVLGTQLMPPFEKILFLI